MASQRAGPNVPTFFRRNGDKRALWPFVATDLGDLELDRGWLAKNVTASPRAAVRDRRSLRKTDLIQAPQRSPPSNEVCQNTPHGFATDLRSHTAKDHG